MKIVSSQSYSLQIKATNNSHEVLVICLMFIIMFKPLF